MGNKRNRDALIAFICSLVPIVPAAILLALCLSLSSVKGEAEGMATVFLIMFVGFITAALMMVMGIISIVLGNIAIKKPGPRGEMLAKCAIVLGILEVATFGFFCILVFWWAGIFKWLLRLIVS